MGKHKYFQGCNWTEVIPNPLNLGYGYILAISSKKLYIYFFLHKMFQVLYSYGYLP